MPLCQAWLLLLCLSTCSACLHLPPCADSSPPLPPFLCRQPTPTPSRHAHRPATASAEAARCGSGTCGCFATGCGARLTPGNGRTHSAAADVAHGSRCRREAVWSPTTATMSSRSKHRQRQGASCLRAVMTPAHRTVNLHPGGAAPT